MSHSHLIYDTDNHFTIDPVTRKITSEASAKTSIMQYDHNSERFTFEMPRRIEGHDMAVSTKAEIHFINIDVKTKEQSKGIYPVADLHVDPEDPEKVLCSWLLSQTATKYAGSLTFIVRFVCLDDENIVIYAWNTDKYTSISVSEGILNDTGELLTPYVDILAAWEKRLIAVEQGAGGSGGSSDVEVSGRLGGYYTPVISQTDENTIEFGYVGSEVGMPIISSKTVTLPSGRDGNPGTDGAPGVDGISPLVSIIEVTGGYRMTIIDEAGSKSFVVANGLSAYQIAVEHGYEGTEEEWAEIFNLALTYGEGENAVKLNNGTNQALGDNSVALGENNSAGSKAYTIVRVDAENKRYYLDSLAGFVEVFDESVANVEPLYYSVRVDFIRTKYGNIVGYGVDPDGTPYVECEPFFDSGQTLDPERDYFQVFKHAELGTKNIGRCAIVNGDGNIANEYSDVGGYNSTAGKFGFTRGKTNDVGYASSAFGELMQILGLKCFGAGYNGYIDPSVEGAGTLGRNNTIRKRGFAFGEGLLITISGIINKLVVGRYNAPKNNTLFEIGNGSNDSDRKNVFEVLNDGTVNANGDPLLRRTPNPAVNGVYVEMRPDPNTNAPRGYRLYNLTQGVEANSIPERSSGGHLAVPQTPTADSHATSKKYVDTKYQEAQDYADEKYSDSTSYTDSKVAEITGKVDGINYVERQKQTATGYKAYVELGSKDANGNVVATTELKVISGQGTASALAQYNTNGRLADGKNIAFDKYAETELPNKRAISNFVDSKCDEVKELVAGLPFKSANITCNPYTETSVTYSGRDIYESGLYFINVTGKWGADSVNITVPCYISLVEGENGYHFIKSFNNDDKPFAIYLVNHADHCSVSLCKLVDAPDTFNLTMKIL